MPQTIDEKLTDMVRDLGDIAFRLNSAGEHDAALAAQLALNAVAELQGKDVGLDAMEMDDL